MSSNSPDRLDAAAEAASQSRLDVPLRAGRDMRSDIESALKEHNIPSAAEGAKALVHLFKARGYLSASLRAQAGDSLAIYPDHIDGRVRGQSFSILLSEQDNHITHIFESHFVRCTADLQRLQHDIMAPPCTTPVAPQLATVDLDPPHPGHKPPAPDTTVYAADDTPHPTQKPDWHTPQPEEPYIVADVAPRKPTPQSEKTYTEEIPSEGTAGMIARIGIETAQKNGLPEQLVLAMLRQESSYTLNPRTGRPEAQGPMQLMPEAMREMGFKYITEVRTETDVRNNISAGCKYLKRCLNQFNQDPILACIAYNAGPGKVQAWLTAYYKKNPTGPIDYQHFCRGVYRESREYVLGNPQDPDRPGILHLMQQYEQALAARQQNTQVAELHEK